MPVFQYVALDSQGVEIKDEIEALSEKEAISKIRNMGYFPTKVRSKATTVAKAGGKAAKAKKRRGAGAKVKVRHVTQFARQLSTLQDAGLPVLRSLRILEEQAKKGSFKRIIGYVADDIEGGSTLSEAFAKYPRCFDRLFVNMIAAGEAGGVLDLILSRVADFKEKAERLKGRVKGAMIYPIVVLCAALGIVLGLMTFVIPQFAATISEMAGGKLNPVTAGVMRVSGWIAKEYGWAWMIGIPIGMVFFLRFIRRYRVARLVLDSIQLRLPILGQLTSKISITRWTRTLGTLISAGVPILDAINVTRETAGNEVYANMLVAVHNSIRQGDTFAGPLRLSKTVDLLVANMVAVGEETGDLDKMLLKVADQYDEQVDVLVGSLMHLLEPIMIIGLGAIVGVIVMAVFLPMIQVISSLGASSGG
ncbi:MAG: type II secretion system F family protein [Phycisphaerales bacterium]|jgi:type IV pilus assembly protein PilC